MFFLHEDDDVDIGKNQFLGSSSESENEVSFLEKLVDWTNKFSMRVHKDCNELNVEEQISEVLKYAPSKAGGSRFKV